MVGRWECCNGGTARILTIFRAKITVITARTAVIWRCFSLRSLAHQHRARIRLTPRPALAIDPQHSTCHQRLKLLRYVQQATLFQRRLLSPAQKLAKAVLQSEIGNQYCFAEEVHHLCHPLFGYASCSSSMQLLQYICVLLLGYARMLGARHIQITYLAMLCEVVFTTQRGAMMRCWAVCPPTLGLYADSDYPQS